MLKFIAATRQFHHKMVAHFCMKMQRIGIFRSYQGIQHPVALAAQHVLQHLVQLCPDALSPGLGHKINGRLGAPAVGRPGKWRTGIGIALDYAFLVLPNQPGKTER